MRAADVSFHPASGSNSQKVENFGCYNSGPLLKQVAVILADRSLVFEIRRTRAILPCLRFFFSFFFEWYLCAVASFRRPGDAIFISSSFCKIIEPGKKRGIFRVYSICNCFWWNIFLGKKLLDKIIPRWYGQSNREILCKNKSISFRDEEKKKTKKWKTCKTKTNKFWEDFKNHRIN